MHDSKQTKTTLEGDRRAIAEAVRKRSARPPNPALDAARDIATEAKRTPRLRVSHDREADVQAVEHPRRVTASELRARANRAAVALAAAFEELSELQRAIGASAVEPPAPPRFAMRTPTDAELRARAEAPGWAPWADGDLDGA